MTCPSVEQLDRFASDDLPVEQQAALKAHLMACDECRRTLEQVRGNLGLALQVGAAAATETRSDTISVVIDDEANGLAVAEPVARRGSSSGVFKDRFPGYEVLRELHRGGQGVVYQAVQLSTKRKAAIKVLLEGPHASKSAMRRFEREIELAASLKHPNIISIFHSGETKDGQQFCVMDYVRGAPLVQYVRDKKPAMEDALRLFAKVCDAVNYAHQKGVIHRDLKPSNILVDSSGAPKVLDFGLAKQLGGPEQTLVSLTGQMVGTLPYMSPEQARGNPDEIDVRTDVYALGVVLYEMLTGHYPYPVIGSIADVLQHIQGTQPTPPSRSWNSDSGVTRRLSGRLRSGTCPIDDDLQTIMLKALSKERDRRYQGAGELARDIDHYLAGDAIEAKRDSALYVLRKMLGRHRRRVGAVAAVILLTAVAGWAAVTAGRLKKAQAQLANQSVVASYDRLIYENYRTDPDQIKMDLDQAVEQGADNSLIAVTRSLSLAGERDFQAAISALATVDERTAHRADVLYLMSWLHDEVGEHAAARRYFDEAEAGEGGRNPPAWFLRGLALHKRDPFQAIDSYRNAAVTAGKEEGRLFLQAILHTARAQNQVLYKHRDLEHIEYFQKSETVLQQLIYYESYEDNPYYLLSIAHRYAGDIYSQGSANDDQLRAEQHYLDSLRFARQGQEQYPKAYKPIFAEAECLETLGQFVEAIEVRNRALEVTDVDINVSQALHYRWRLYYWTQQFDLALADLAELASEHAANDSAIRVLYKYIYPAILYAEQGDSVSAQESVIELAEKDEFSASDAIWASSILRILQRADQADSILSAWVPAARDRDNLAQEPDHRWYRMLHGYGSGEMEWDVIAQFAGTSENPLERMAELHFHAAAQALGDGDRDTAFDHLDAAYRSFDGEQLYTYHAKVLLERMKQDPAWPRWIPLSHDTQGGEWQEVDESEEGR